MATYFDFTVSLQDVLPRPWRRFLIAGTASFATLSTAIQDACGWSGGHLFRFQATGAYDGDAIAGLRIGDGDDDMDGIVPDAKNVKVTRQFAPGRSTTCLYLYDFGDDWTHDVQLNDVVSLRQRFRRRLAGGEHAFPPEDCGGPWGYMSLRAAMRTGRDPDGLVAWARETWGWTGEFDLDVVRAAFDK